MASNFPPLPMRPGAATPPPEPPTDQSDISGLVSESGPATPMVDPQQKAREFMAMIRKFHGEIDALARQNPLAAKGARIVKQGLMVMMRDIVTSEQVSPEPAAPRMPA